MYGIGTAAKLSGIGIEAIRYYEREGVVPRAERSASGRRLYSDAEIARLRFVKRCRDLGFSISQVKALIALSSNTTTQCAEVMVIGNHHLEPVQKKMADLRELENALLEMLEHCSVGREECPMLRQLFAG